MRQSKRLPSTKELAICTRQLATMLSSGIPILSALNHLELQTKTPSLRQAISDSKLAITNGVTLADSFKLNPLIFNRLYTALLHAGERAGILEETLETLATELEASHSLRMRLIRAATYPAVVLFTLIAVMTFLLTWVIPTFEDLFAETGVALPWLTQVVLDASRFASRYWLVGLNLSSFSLLALLLLHRRSEVMRLKLSNALTNLPIYGGLVRKQLATQSANLLSALTRSGIPILEALTIIAESAPIPKLTNEMLRIRGEVLQGDLLSHAFARSTIMPPLISQMVAIGEASGRLDLMLGRAGTLIKQELDTTIENLKQLTEPCLILTVGIVVGIIALAIYAPIFQIGELAGGR
ncbi:MAG: type II secretion system F family protein [Pseudomonadota bacterium]|jgi:type IV pilus assembly protein PilC